MKLSTSLFLCLMALIPASSPATVRDVPGQYSTINAALQAAAESDSVLVHSGVYPERIIFPATDICLISEYALTGDTNAILNTVIDASQFAGQDTSSVFVFLHGNSPQTKVIGFTISGGHGVLYDYGWYWGGAIFVMNSHPTIQWNRIIGNRAYIFSTAVFEGSYSTVSHNSFRDNCANRGFIEIAYNRPLGQSFVFEWNDVTGHYGCEGSDSLYMQDDCVYALQADLTARYNRFHDYAGYISMGVDYYNSVGEAYGNVFEGLSAVWGARVLNAPISHQVSIHDNVFRDIELSPGPCISLGRLRMFGTNAVERNWFENIFQSGFGPACIFVQAPNVYIADNVFVNCTSVSGAIQTSQNANEGCVGVIERNHFFANSVEPLAGDTLGSAITALGYGPQCQIRNNWFEGNEAPAVFYDEYDQYQPWDLSQNYWGDSTGPYHQTLNPEGLGDTLFGNFVISPWLLEPPVNQIAPPILPSRVTNWSLQAAYPNPFNSSTRFRLVSDRSQAFEVNAYNISGQLVRTIWRGVVTKDNGVDVTWDGQDGQYHPCASGLYLIMARPLTGSNSIPQTTKALLLR